LGPDEAIAESLNDDEHNVDTRTPVPGQLQKVGQPDSHDESEQEDDPTPASEPPKLPLLGIPGDAWVPSLTPEGQVSCWSEVLSH
jgi:hypothetical protein